MAGSKSTVSSRRILGRKSYKVVFISLFILIGLAGFSTNSAHHPGIQKSAKMGNQGYMFDIFSDLFSSKDMLSLKKRRNSGKMKHKTENDIPSTWKVAFLFLTNGELPMERLWVQFFQNFESQYSIYLHSSDPSIKFTRHRISSKIFSGRQVPTQHLFPGDISTVDSERRIVFEALKDPQNKYFVSLSETTIPLYGFRYIRNTLLSSNYSFVDSKKDYGADGDGRWSVGMLPEVPKESFRKGIMWFALTRKHAATFATETKIYKKFVECKPSEPSKKCFPEEHYLQTLLNIVDPAGSLNCSLTFIDWSGMNWSPREFKSPEISAEFISQLQDLRINAEMPDKGFLSHLFAEKFSYETLEGLLHLSSSTLGFKD